MKFFIAAIMLRLISATNKEENSLPISGKHVRLHTMSLYVQATSCTSMSREMMDDI